VYGEDPPTYRVKGGSGGTVFVAFLTAAITSAGMFFALREFVPPKGVPAEETVEVPSLSGMNVEQARQMLDGKGLYLTLEAEREDPNVPAGQIATQNPLAGSREPRRAAR
jgi:hypothetical protein